ncbi:hypothetical protein C4577_03580 [Candidatus Parcubacteria bacterium]|nr:MAG: hypothetical protein C4577_03580 [Candidatus Parcubacteria bacterium]
MSVEHGWRDQSMPKVERRSLSEENSGNEQLHFTISNLRAIILKHEATIERLQRQLAEEKIKNMS